MEKIKKLITPTNNKLEDDLVNLKKSLLGKLCPNIEDPRFGGKIAYDFDELINQFSILPVDGYEPNYVLSEIIGKLCKYVPNWRSPNLHYNVGAPINIVSSMAYSFALENNIFTINNALSGNTLIAESAVTNILSSLAGLNPDSTIGWFTFGGTGINLYGLKVGINKSAPLSRKNGINKNVKVFTTKNAHFGHFISTEWLGVGTDNVIIIDANKDGTTNISDFKNKLEYEIRNNSIIGCIYLNGGTSYNHIVDDIDEFVKFRDELTTKYQLSYKPHIHVDSVIGWFWLFFKGYNFIKNYYTKNKISICKNIKNKICR
jgi:glutamate/tyrosine decarboxylase-like PLP-dependent enzyme